MSYTERFMELYKKGKVDDGTMIKMAVFKEEVQELIKKGGLSKNQILAGAGLGALISTTAGVAEAGLERYLSSKSKRETEEEANEVFEKIYKRQPKINKHPKELAREYFRSILHFSPHIATDPLAAESFLINAMTWVDDDRGEFPTHTVREMSDIEDKTQKALNSRYGGAGSSATSLVEPIRKALSSEPKNLYTAYAGGGVLSEDNPYWQDKS